MSRQSSKDSPAELLDELSDWAVGGGIVAMALFPFAVPLVALTAVALLPLLAMSIAVGILVAVVMAPIVAVRSALRALRAKDSPATAPRSGRRHPVPC